MNFIMTNSEGEIVMGVTGVLNPNVLPRFGHCALTLTVTGVVMAVPHAVAVAGAQPATVPADTACSQFSAAIDLAAVNYSDFADATSGDQWNHRDPLVRSANVAGRTALRESASAVWDAAGTPGLPPELAGSMHRWSSQAAKLLVLMGVRANLDTVNKAAAELNELTFQTQDACADAQFQN